MKDVSIRAKRVGVGQPVFVIAEAGVNHNGNIELAKKLIDAAKRTGADAVKFQTFTPDEMVMESAEQAEYQKRETGVVESQSAMLKKLALSPDSFRDLKKYAAHVGIEFLSTPFSIADADFLHSLDLAAYKVSSGDLTNLPFLEHLATFGMPIILSTGMATLAEVREAVETLQKARVSEIIVLQCTSEYPAPLSHANLRAVKTLRLEFDVPVGFSDHTEGISASIYAASLGACLIEKHLTLDRNLPGPDHAASLEPDELKEMIATIRRISTQKVEVPEDVLGSGEKIPTEEERAVAKLVRKGIAARVAIAEGDVLTPENLIIARPEGTIAPKEWKRVLGARATRAIPRGTSLSWDMIERV